MPLHFVEHEIQDNVIVTNKKPNELNRETVLLGAEKIVVGVATDKQVVKVDPVTGLNYLANQVDAQEVYNLRKQAHSSWFVLDLETGERGWYPGSKLVADIVGSVDIKKDMEDDSETLITIKDETIELLFDAFDKSRVKWYKVKYNEIEGYIKAQFLSNIRYIDRTE